MSFITQAVGKLFGGGGPPPLGSPANPIVAPQAAPVPAIPPPPAPPPTPVQAPSIAPTPTQATAQRALTTRTATFLGAAAAAGQTAKPKATLG